MGENLELNPAQREVIEQLGAATEDRPVFRADLRHQLVTTLEQAVKPHLDCLPLGEQLFLTKHRLAMVHGCETRFLQEEDSPFSWRLPMARGIIVHKAVELSVNWRREKEPAILVDESLSRFEADSSEFGHWLRACTESDRAELRSEALEAVSKFLECWPELLPAWRPVTESRVRAELSKAQLILAGKVDLTLGIAEGHRAGKVIIDLKTGAPVPTHREDLRFYALVETLRIGVPPRLVASYYLDQARIIPEQIVEETLIATVARVSDGIRRIVELRHKEREPNKLSGPACRWCSLLETCDEGQGYITELEEGP